MKRTLVATTALVVALALSGCTNSTSVESGESGTTSQSTSQSGAQSGSSSDQEAVATVYGTLLTSIVGMDQDKVNEVISAQEEEVKDKDVSDVSDADLTKYGDQLLEVAPLLSLINVEGKSALERYVSYASVLLSGQTLASSLEDESSADVDVPMTAVTVSGDTATIDLSKVTVAGKNGSGAITLVKKNGSWLVDSSISSTSTSESGESGD